MHSNIYAFQQVGNAFIIPRDFAVEKYSTGFIANRIDLADYVSEININRCNIEDEMEMLSNWGNGKIFNVNKVDKDYFMTVSKEGIYEYVEGNCAKLRTMLNDRNCARDIIQSYGVYITQMFDDRSDIYICLDEMVMPIHQFIYYYYIVLYHSVGDNSLMLTQLFDYHF